MTDSPPRVLIEDWLPVAELGIESRRERGAASALPPLSFLHVWWARRPLVASAGVVLGGLLPAWTDDVADWLRQHLGTLSTEQRRAVLSPRPFLHPTPVYSDVSEDWYRNWVLHLIGIWGDPVLGKAIIDEANAEGVKLEDNGYGYRQAFRNQIDRTHIDVLHGLIRHTWGGGPLPLVMDSTAGGGSIPFTAARLGLPTHANDLNGVAAAVLEAGVRAPALYGNDLTQHLEKWGKTLVGRIEERIERFFPLVKDERVIAYIWANTVACPRTGRVVPLIPVWWLRKGGSQAVAVRLVTELDGVELHTPRFEVVSGSKIDFDPNQGTVARGNAISPYDNLVIDGEYIKAEAQAGRMGHVMYAVATKTGKVRGLRAPTDDDITAIKTAEMELDRLMPDWRAADLLPAEEFPAGNDLRPLHYGMNHWTDFFSARQLLAQGVFAEEFRGLIPEVRAAIGGDKANHVLMQLAVMQGKALNWNSRLSSWNVGAQGMRSVFDRHDFAFKWTFAEFEGRALYGWCLDQLIDAYSGISSLLDDTGRGSDGSRLPRSVEVTRGNAADLPSVKDRSVAHLCMDPPYYDNVMYAELADFFYVWEKRTLGRIAPQFFKGDLTDKDNEAVASPARFAALGRRRKELADADYEAKMTAIFGEARRVLRDDGVLSVMFTHKRAEAWDTLGMGLLQAGFTIETSWPVNTERELSLHQANMNSASSTIMLVCRKRGKSTLGGRIFLDDIEADIRAAAREAATRFQHDGIDGVDLLLSTYGPTLSVISRSWPVYSSTPDADGRERLLRPEEALDLAREEVVRLRRTRLVGKAAQIDDVTDFVLLAWDIFGAKEFPFDTARLLALAVGGLDVDLLTRAKVVAKGSGTVTLLPPKDRVRRGQDTGLPGVRTDASRFTHVIDAVHTALYIADQDGMPDAKRFMDRAGLTNSDDFLSTVQGLVNAIPRTKAKGQWVIPEAGTLDTLATLYLPSIRFPAEAASKLPVETEKLF